jgi:site-specific recombinase XerC
MDSTCQVKGGEDLHPHRLRHTSSTFFLNSRGGLKALQEPLGRGHDRTPEISAQSLESPKEAAVDDLEDDPEEPPTYREA